jgi:hypothetical protein
MQTFQITDPKVARRCRFAQLRGEKATLILEGLSVTGMVQSIKEDKSSFTSVEYYCGTECGHCSPALAIRPRHTPIWILKATLKCRSCRKARYASPANTEADDGAGDRPLSRDAPRPPEQAAQVGHAAPLDSSGSNGVTGHAAS